MAEVYGFGDEEVRRESSWRYALGIFAATLILSAVFLYHYVGPSVDDIAGSAPKPTISDETALLAIGQRQFSVPANHTVYPRARRDGQRDSVALYALWPTMAPYSPARRNYFIENEPRSRRIDIRIAQEGPVFPESERLHRLYLPLTLPNSATRTPSGLVRYSFVERRPDTPTNGYADKELFIGEGVASQVVLLCGIESDRLPAPECRREFELDGVSVVYRFKRPYLPEWRAIDARVQEFIGELDATEASAREAVRFIDLRESVPTPDAVSDDTGAETADETAADDAGND